MKHFLVALALAVIFPALASAQTEKGIDTQTQKIKQDANKTTTRTNDNGGRSFDWGKGKTQVRDLLPNPYRLNARRDALLDTIVQVLKERQMVVDDASSRMRDGIVITQPYVFAKGPVTAQNELNRYGVLTSNDSAWSRGRYTLTIEVQSIDGVQNNVSVNAKVEGRTNNGLSAEWASIQSSGLAEDEFLAKLIEAVTGNSPDPVVKTDQP